VRAEATFFGPISFTYDDGAARIVMFVGEAGDEKQE
jgi:hypothetical protein